MKPETIAHMLLRQVYSPITVVAAFCARGRLCALRQYDTHFAQVRLPEGVRAKQIWLISNHPEGCMEPYEADLRNVRSLESQQNVCVRLFLMNEDFGLLEIKSPDAE